MKRLPVLFMTSAVAFVAACATLLPSDVVVARSRLGTITATEFQRFLAERNAPADLDRAGKQARLEELLIVRAAEAEAESLGLLETPSGAARLARRQEAILVAEMRARLDAAAAAEVSVDEAAVEAAYAERAAVLAVPERLSLRHVFKRLPANATAEERRAIEAAMQALLAELRAGADFKTIARQHSESQTSVFDGMIAPIAPGDVDPALAETLWRLEPGEMTDVVVTPIGLHIFKLEKRLPPPDVPPEDLRRSLRTRLERQALDAALKQSFDALLKASGATFQPDLVDDPEVAADRVVFALEGDRLTAGEIAERWRRLPFVQQRTTSLRSLLEQEAAHRLLLYEARRLGLADEPAMADQLHRAWRRLLYEAAEDRRVAELADEVTEEELRRFYTEESRRYFWPERRRLRGIIVPLVQGRSPHAVYDELDRVARQIRAGTEDLAAAARQLSQDPSRAQDGDLGWAEAKDLAIWAGPRVPSAVFTQTVGEVSAPLLVERYDSDRLRDEPTAYLVVRVEEIQPERTAAFEDVATEVRERYLARRTGVIGERLRAGFLAAIEAEIYEDRLQ